MKKTFYILIAVVSITVTSCSSGWSCQSRYVHAPSKVVPQKTTIHQVNS